MVRSRVYGILAGYQDRNDHDALRTDPVFKLVADRSPDDPAPASQPTLSRFANGIDIPSLKRLRDVLLDPSIASFPQAPRRLTCDLGAVDDPAHGHQQLTFWHGYDDQNQYLPLFITCPDDDQFVMPSLRPGHVRASLGADDGLEYLVQRLRQAWPAVAIVVRGDSAFGIPRRYAVCERLGLTYAFGLAAHAVLQRHRDALLAQAVTTYQQECQAARRQEPPRVAVPRRLFLGWWYQAGSWDRPRYVVVKAEANARGTNRRFVVANRLGAALLPGATYDEYVERGDSESRNQGIECGLAMDRLSDQRSCANPFRLYRHALAMNLPVRLRRLVADPPPAAPAASEVPAAAQRGEERRRQFRARRQRDPLGEGRPCTWRSLVIKVAAEVVVSARRVLVRLSSSGPHQEWYRRVCERIRAAGVATASG